jgi:hypothetical protein
MDSRLDISPGEGQSEGGGGPDYDGRFTARTLRRHGFLALAFGFALGLTFMIFFGLFQFVEAPTAGLRSFAASGLYNLMLSFLYGFIGGTLLAAMYNLLMFKRLNLFGLDRNMD